MNLLKKIAPQKIDINIRFSLYIFYSVVLYSLLSIIWGADFYRLNVLNISISEFVVILSLTTFLFIKKQVLVFRVRIVFYLIYAYWFLALVYSFTVEQREIYFILRQSIHLFYFLLIPTATYSLIILRRSGYFEARNDRGYLLLITVALFIGLQANEGHMDGAFVTLIIIFTLFRMHSLILSILVAILFIIYTGHASHKLAVLMYFSVILFYRIGNTFRPIFVVGVIFSMFIMVVTPGILNEALDKNAVWRYLYWRDLIIYMTDNFRFFTGIGYGVPYMQTEFDNFYLLYSQVESGRGEFQIYTVPPHNSILAIWYHLGVLPAIVFSVFLIKVSWMSIKLNNIHELAAMSAISVILLTHNGLELPYMALLIVYVIAIVLSSNYIKIEELKDKVSQTRSLGKYIK